ncbi:MAG: hypothetical protein RJA57_598 [Bacteroidota bacterium]|jgi:hypothetical protein
MLLVLVVTGCRSKRIGDTGTDSTDSSSWSPGWEATLNDSTGRIGIRRRLSDGPDSLTPTAVIRYLNRMNPRIELHYRFQSGDTCYTDIPRSEYLTHQIGSTGAESYFMEAVYNLTEIPGIHHVRFDFREGDHAQPDVLSRESFTPDY